MTKDMEDARANSAITHERADADFPANADLVNLLFKAILDREVENEEFLRKHDGTHSIYYWADRLVKSDEFRNLFIRKHGLQSRDKDFIKDANYRTPTLTSAIKPSLVLLTGSCAMDGWEDVLKQEYSNTIFRRQTFNNASELEDLTDEELRRANFQVVQIPLRSVIPEAEYLALTLSDADKSKLQNVFDASLYRLKRNLEVALKYNRGMGIPVFVLNFGVPQANPLGFLMPKYELTNFSFFVGELNRALHQMISTEKSVFLVDFNEITSTLGKRFIQDDITSHLNHGSLMGGTPNLDDTYMTPLGAPERLYGPIKQQATLATFNECVASYSIVSSTNKIKIAIFDLDGTLWRGVPADRDDLGGHLIEGWPLSVLEAAAFLKKRGILLAIASKNDPGIAERIWNHLYGSVFPLSNFVSKKFSWESKVNSVTQILRETNLLPSNCLFVDDNPVEREQVQLAFPDIKIISGPIFTWRRTLLWATELQTQHVSEESTRRTESIQTVIQRESVKETLDEDDYLRQLAVRVQIEDVNRIDHRRFKRAFELLNKTNQFNTTGRRWTEQELSQYFADGGRLIACDVSDRLTNYGLTAILLERGVECTQIVMSCRVFGLFVEFSLFGQFLLRGRGERRLLFRHTGKNGLCRKFFHRAELDVPEDIPVTDGGLAIAISSAYALPTDLAKLSPPVALSSDCSETFAKGYELKAEVSVVNSMENWALTEFTNRKAEQMSEDLAKALRSRDAILAENGPDTLRRTIDSYVRGVGGNEDDRRWMRARLITLLREDGFQQDPFEPGRLRKEVVEKYCPALEPYMFKEISPYRDTAITLLPRAENRWLDVEFAKPWQKYQPTHFAREELPEEVVFLSSDADLVVDGRRYIIISSDGKSSYSGCNHADLSTLSVPSSVSSWRGPIVLINDQFDCGNIAHFLFDCSIRLLHWCAKFPEKKRNAVFVFGGVPRGFHRLILGVIAKTLGIDQKQFWFPSALARLRALEGLYWFASQMKPQHPCNFGRIESVSLLQELARNVLTSINPTIEKAKRIYISRVDSGGRRPINETEIVSMLETMGFRALTMSQYSWAEQIGLVAGAEYIIAPHGMGLTHLVFNLNRPKIIEMFSPYRFSDAYAILSRAYGDDYVRVIGDEVDSTRHNFYIELEHLRSRIDS